MTACDRASTWTELPCTREQGHPDGCVHDGGSGMAHHRHEDDGGDS